MSEDTFRVRDRRTQSRYFVDNCIVRDYGKDIKPIGIAVYNALCLHADIDDQTCYPSHDRIATLIGSSVSSVQRSLAQLRELKLLEWGIRMGPSGGQSSNIYVLLDPPVRVTDPPRSERPTPSVRVTDEQSPSIKPKVHVPSQESDGNVVTIEMDEEDEGTTCPVCYHYAEWPRSERERKTAANLICLECGARFIVKGFKVFGGGPYTYTHPDVRKASRQSLKCSLTAAFCRLAQLSYKGLSPKVRLQWERQISDVAGDHTTEEIVTAIDSMSRIGGLENPWMLRFINPFSVALQSGGVAFTLDDTTGRITEANEEESGEMVLYVDN